jgi:hypothetical protein
VGRWTPFALLAILGALALAPSANAGRLIETGHDIDFHCGGSQNSQCHFVRVALDWVRKGAPNPSAPVLVLDRDPAGANTADVVSAVNKAFGTGAVPMVVRDPRSAAFASQPINTSLFSAIFVASDINCGGCDLNEIHDGTNANTPDSTGIAARTQAMSSFFNAGGGILAGAGDDHSGGFGGLVFSSANRPYYDVLATAGAGPVGGPFSLTSIGTGIGITTADLGFASCGAGCTHNSFGFPPAGSDLKVAETDPGTGRFITLVQDSDPPRATITGQQTGGDSGTFAFTSNESKSTFQCAVDNGAYGACGSPRTVSGLSDGRHTFNVRAVDLVGNVQPTSTSASFCLPGGSERTGNRVDEDCDGFSAPYDEIDSSIRFSFRFTSRRTFVTTMNLARVTRSTTLRVRCRGRGCPFRSRRVRLRRGRAKLSRIFRRRGRRVGLRPRTSISISLTRSGWTSKVYRFRVRRAAIPTFGTFCQLPGTSRLRRSCPSFR